MPKKLTKKERPYLSLILEENFMLYKTVKHVALYLCKSRDDGEYEDVLSKHRDALNSFVEKKGWSYES